MPTSKTSDPQRLTLTELIKLRGKVPPVPADAPRTSLSDRFLVPPFSVLDARQGYWQKRKKMWLSLGIKSELGRGETPGTHYSDVAEGHYRTNATPGGSPRPAMRLGEDGRTRRGDGAGRELNAIPGGGSPRSPSARNGSRRLGKTYNIGMDANKENDWSTEDNQGSGTSIFDPVLCELAYRWFCPVGGRILDPFAGGSVRGIVAARLGRAYIGVDLRPEQAAANEAQRDELCPGADLQWVVGDANNIPLLAPGEYDLVFSCPPYADLERYSDDPRDLSTMPYDEFLVFYRHIINESCKMLRDNRFACFVVGDVRDRETGTYRNFVSDTIEAFHAAGLELYNEAILVTSVGSLPIRVSKQFVGSRKLGKTHQNVLVFVKGDPARAAAACGEVDVDDLEMPECTVGCTVAICAQDVAGSEAEGYYDGDGTDVPVLDYPPVEACLLADVIRGKVRSEGEAVPRTWIRAEEGWQRVPDNEELTYLIGDVPYLNRNLFPDASRPVDVAPPPQRLRG